MQRLENASILTPTGGFPGTGYTHTIDAYQGCAFAGSLRGTYCYAQHNRWITKGRVLLGSDGFNAVGRGSGEVGRSPETSH